MAHPPWTLLLPWTLYTALVYDTRPDTVHSKTRAPEWAKLQSQWRWAHAYICYLGPPSFLLWRIRAPLLFNLMFAALAALDAQASWFGGLSIKLSDDVLSAWHMLSFVLALLLAFRVNRVYLRWSAALQAFGGVGTASVTLAQQAALWVPESRLQAELLRWCAVWQFSLHHLVTRAKALDPKVACLLSNGELAAYHAAPKPRQLVVQQLRQLATRARLDTGQFLAMNDALAKGNSDMGTCGRVFFYAMPYSLSLVCTGFLEIWLLLLPIATTVDKVAAGEAPHVPAAPPPAAGAIALSVAWDLAMHALACILTLGVDEVTNQLEQPFAYIPTLDMSDATLRAVQRAADETATMVALTDLRLQQPSRGANGNGSGCSASSHRSSSPREHGVPPAAGGSSIPQWGAPPAGGMLGSGSTSGPSNPVVAVTVAPL